MSLNVKNEEAHALARELAARLMRIGAECAARLPEGFKNMNPDDLLFDEKGSPFGTPCAERRTLFRPHG